jgi:peroxiredoxin Q/BCP
MAQKTSSKGARHKAQNTPQSKGIARSKAAKPGLDTTLAIGQKAPNFTLPRDGGGSASLADSAGRKLVLYFYPRADTSGCTKEAIDYSRLKGEFSRAGADILGVSADPVKALDAFKHKHNLTIALASDETHKMLKAYGVWQEKTMYGRKFLGIVRSTFLIGPDRRIAQVWPRVSVEGHAAAVLAAVKAL